MNNYLMVPIKVDALYVEGDDISVVEQAADFTSQPYFDNINKREINCEAINISEYIVSKPFQNKSLRLGHGIHLHWSLPDALTRGDQNLQFPEVPDRWIITRIRGGNKEKEWIVESNYLYPPGIDKKGVAINIPFNSERWIVEDNKYNFSPDKDNDKGLDRCLQPYRYMGRKMILSAWKEKFSDCEYYPELTATGWGNPAFAAFYPNSFSVFGFHDGNIGGDITDLTYQITGWYSDETKDFIRNFIKDNPTEINAKIKKKFNWSLKNDNSPDSMLLYGGIEFKKDPITPDKEREITLTVGNTQTEALSAFLANKLSSNINIRQQIEDQLEAMQLEFRLRDKKLDTLARFKELRHENEFTAVNSGFQWILKKDTVNKDKEIPDSLPDSLNTKLDKINKLQREYNDSIIRIELMRKQLFSDWYKYMICCYPPDNSISDYPDPDLVKYFIETKDIKPLESAIFRTGKIKTLTRNGKGRILKLEEESSKDSLAAHLVGLVDNLNFELENNKLQNYYLDQIPSPRFWQPNNPVLLIEGEQHSKRHGCDGMLQCDLFSAELYTIDYNFDLLTEAVGKLLKSGNFGYNLWTKQPWNPMFLEWQVQLFPLLNNSNQHKKNGYYSPEFISDNYEASPMDPELSLIKGKGKIANTGSIYTGTSILTPSANTLLKRELEESLIDKYKIFKLPEEISLKNYKGKKGLNNPIYTMIKTYEELKQIYTLSQSLNGFNEALLMHKQTMELPVDDPLGFNIYRNFSNYKVDTVLDQSIKIAPSPLFSFNPIRSGCLKIINARLVDNFGQTKDINTSRINTTCKMTPQGSSYLINLPPRVVQPARLNFRWLDGISGEMESNSCKNTSPICGWLISNKYDNSISFYNSDGNALGYFQGGIWRPAVDSEKSVEIDDINNKHLRRVIYYIRDSIGIETHFLEYFIKTIDDALDNINPEKNTGYKGPALLMGRPLAIVRSSINLELYGFPAINQDWNVFRKDIGKNSRSNDQFPWVQFPVRLGQYGQFNDGLVGYWLEKKSSTGDIFFCNEYKDKTGKIISENKNIFYSPQSDYIDSETIESGFEYAEDGPINFYQSIYDEPQTITMLLDVQGSVHATVGILPDKEIKIPEEHYIETLKNIEVSFLCAPLLTKKGKVNIPLRSMKDYSWSWVESNGTEKEFTEIFPEKRIKKSVFIEAWNKTFTPKNGEHIWDQLLKEEWLILIEGETLAKVDIKEKKTNLNPKQINEIINQYSESIDAPYLKAQYAESEIIEGWLKLRKKEDLSS